MTQHRFVPHDADASPLTPRTRFLLWQALGQLTAAIDMDLAEVRDGVSAAAVIDSGSSQALHDFPPLVRSQPLEWWEQVLDAADRLTEAARTGDGLAPRTPAEEAVIYIATACGWTDVGADLMAPTVRDQFTALPAQEDDFDWGEVLPALTGDADVEQLWMPQFDGLSDPNNELNRDMGIGDYTPRAWHRLFDRYRAEVAGDPEPRPEE